MWSALNQITLEDMSIIFLIQGLVLATSSQFIRGYHSTNHNYIRNILTHGRSTSGFGGKRADAVTELHELCLRKEKEKLLDAPSYCTMESCIESVHDVQNGVANFVFEFLVRWVLWSSLARKTPHNSLTFVTFDAYSALRSLATAISHLTKC